MARPLNLSENLLNGVASLSASGFTQKAIFELLGIPSSTYYYWRTKALEAEKKDKKDLTENDKKYLKFLESLKKGRIVRADEALHKIHNDGSWQSAAWYLERTMPDHFSKKIPFDPEGFVQWMRSRNYPSWAVDQVLTILETAHERDPEAEEHNSINRTEAENNNSEGEGPLESAVEGVPPRQSSLLSKQKDS